MTRHIAWDDAIDDYLVAVGTRETEIQRRLREATRPMPSAGMQIGPDQGQFMGLLVRILGARRVVEIGTFTGYSALSMALALPEDGRLVACDISDEWTSIGRPFWREAGVEHKIDLRLVPALETLATLEPGSIDLAFIDADKASYDAYYEACLKLVRPGGVIAIDNVLWSGKVVDDKDDTADTRALKALNAKIHDDPRVDMSLLPIGDGLTLVRRR